MNTSPISSQVGATPNTPTSAPAMAARIASAPGGGLGWAIKDAAANLKAYLETSTTFSGQEEIIDL